jgi:hypothetical protein
MADVQKTPSNVVPILVCAVPGLAMADSMLATADVEHTHSNPTVDILISCAYEYDYVQEFRRAV